MIPRRADPWPMLYAAYRLLDKVTCGVEFEFALDEVCTQLSVNPVQRTVLRHAYEVLCGTSPFKAPAREHGAHWG